MTFLNRTTSMYSDGESGCMRAERVMVVVLVVVEIFHDLWWWAGYCVVDDQFVLTYSTGF